MLTLACSSESRAEMTLLLEGFYPGEIGAEANSSPSVFYLGWGAGLGEASLPFNYRKGVELPEHERLG